MSRRVSLLSLWVAGVLLACADPSVHREPGEPSPPEVTVEPTRTHIVASFDDGQPAANAFVLLNGNEAGQTDTHGRLDLDIPTGPFQLELRLSTDDGALSRVEKSLDKGAEAQEVAITLPRPVRILSPLEVTISQVHLTWERSRERNFREYKVYANQYFPAFDDKTGFLVHVGTDAAKTDFVLKSFILAGTPYIRPDIDLYFRVYVVKDDGSLAGSNTLHVKTPRWANEPNFTRHYTLRTVRTFGSATAIHGVAFDGSALWFMYREAVGGDDDKDKLKLVRRDPETMAVLQELSFEDYRFPVGLTWDGTSLWGAFAGDEPGDVLIRFNPTTGEREQQFIASQRGSALSWTGSQLLLSNRMTSADIMRINPVTGGSEGILANPFTQMADYRSRGVAYRPGEVWVADKWGSDIAILNDSGEHIGVVSDKSHFVHMTMMNGMLVGVTESSEIFIMSIEP